MEVLGVVCQWSDEMGVAIMTLSLPAGRSAGAGHGSGGCRCSVGGRRRRE
jgi:hypothetical protein